MVNIRRFLMIAGISLLMLIPANAQSDDVNQANILTFIEAAYNNSDVSALNTLFADDFMYHPGGFDKSFLLINILSLRGAIPDMTATPIIVVSDENWVAVHLNIEGTFTNDLIIPESLPIPPTNQPVQFVTNFVFHFNENGQVFEQWVTFDNLNYLAQLQMIQAEPIVWAGSTEPITMTETVNIEQQELALTSYYDAFNRKDPATLDQLLDVNFAAYNPFGSFDKTGQINDLSSLFGALPDLEVTITQIISSGDYSAVLYNMHGNFTQDFVTADGAFPANNGELDLIRVDFFQFDAAKNIIEVREIYDSLDFMVQIGLLPQEMQQP